MNKTILALVVVITVNLSGSAQISYTSGTTYTQDFNGLGNVSGNTYWWSDGISPLPGWYALFGTEIPDTYRADHGVIGTPYFYSFGADGDSDRALGSIAGVHDGIGGDIYYAVAFSNAHTSWTLTSFTVSFTLEQWRDSSHNAQTLAVEFNIDPMDIVSGMWTLLGTVTSPKHGNTGALDGNDPANQVAVSFTFTGIHWQPDAQLWIRIYDIDDPGNNDHGLAIDNFSFSAVPEPTTFALVGLGMGAAGLVTRRLRRKKAVDSKT